MDGWMDRLKTIFARGVITNYTHFIKTPLKKISLMEYCSIYNK